MVLFIKWFWRDVFCLLKINLEWIELWGIVLRKMLCKFYDYSIKVKYFIIKKFFFFVNNVLYVLFRVFLS